MTQGFPHSSTDLAQTPVECLSHAELRIVVPEAFPEQQGRPSECPQAAAGLVGRLLQQDDALDSDHM